VVARGLRCDIEIVKILRCSQPLAVLADHLSKAKLGDFVKYAFREGIDVPEKATRVPKALIQWV